jgi:putative SOS response-associated peptidase YedK
MIPSWAKDPVIGNKMINARAETLAEKPSFKRLGGVFQQNQYELHQTHVRQIL